MRIAIDLRSLMETGGKISGIENYVLNITDRLADRNSDIFGFYNNFKKVQLPSLNSKLKIQQTAIPNKILNAALRFFGLPKFEKLYNDFDLLWMPDLRPFAISKKTKFVLSVHDFSPVVHPEHFSWKRRIWHRVIDYKKSFKRADLLLAISEYTKTDLIKLFGINPEKIKVVYPGVDHSIFKTDLDPVRITNVQKKYDLPEKFILSICTLEPRKNILGLVKAFEQTSDPEAYLVIAGRLGWLYDDLLKAIANSPKKDRIKMLGYVAEADKPYLIANAKMVCYPSYYEGFGFVPLEAMACGVPVITSARTAMAEVCADAALLIEPYAQVDLTAAINNLLSDQALRQSLIAKGLQRSLMFNWEKCADQINQHLVGLVNNN